MSNSIPAYTMPAYRSHKKVWALKIKSIKHNPNNERFIISFVDERCPDRVLGREDFNNKPTPHDGWYYVLYQDGYESFSPPEAFESGYSIIAEYEVQGFGWALKQLHNGSKVRRAGWNGKGMFLFLVTGSTFKVNRSPLLGIYPEGTEIVYQPHIDIKSADGTVVPWNCSQQDMLAVDWELAE